jgi:high affinity Mn2+ porin
VLCAGRAASRRGAAAAGASHPTARARRQRSARSKGLEPADQPGKEKKEDGGNGKDKEEEKEFKVEQFSAHGQATVITEWNGPFHSPYLGPHSFLPMHEWATSDTATLFLGAHCWQGGELYFDPEVAGGLGLSNVMGIAGFPNGDITRVGRPEATPYVARLYFSQTVGFGGEQEKIESGPNQLACYKDVSRFTFTIGKMSATDWFDQNAYSHDPRTQFMNWSLMYNGAWDYPADVRGYTYGMVAELNQKVWALRYGIFGEPSEANGPDIDPKFNLAHGQAVELEYRYKFLDRPGKARAMFYWNRADMGNYREALALQPVDPVIQDTASYDSVKYGFCGNFEQELTDDLDCFLRWGWNDGQTESWAFTEIDRTVALGLLWKGTRWRRPQDQIGTALAINGVSAAHADYLAAGGLGFILGDGRLNYSPEIIWETYYRWQVLKTTSIWVSPDLQLVSDPGYNRDRGPVVIGSVRVHAEF